MCHWSYSMRWSGWKVAKNTFWYMTTPATMTNISDIWYIILLYIYYVFWDVLCNWLCFVETCYNFEIIKKIYLFLCQISNIIMTVIAFFKKWNNDSQMFTRLVQTATPSEPQMNLVCARASAMHRPCEGHVLHTGAHRLFYKSIQRKQEVKIVR